MQSSQTLYSMLLRVVQNLTLFGENAGKWIFPLYMTHIYGPENFMQKIHDLGSPQATYIFPGALMGVKKSLSPKYVMWGIKLDVRVQLRHI